MKEVRMDVGDKISIKFQLSDGTISSISYTSRVEEVLAKDEYIISSPTGTDMSKWVGKNIQIVLPKPGTAYTCMANILEQKAERNVYSFVIRQVSEFVKEQRREYYRLKASLRIKVNTVETRTIDISGNGVAFKFSMELKKGEEIKGTIYLDKIPIEYRAIIVRCNSVPPQQGEPGYYRVSAKFIDMETKEQDAILKYIHERQLEQIRHERGFFGFIFK